MKEKEIIKSELIDSKKIRNTIFLIGFIISLFITFTFGSLVLKNSNILNKLIITIILTIPFICLGFIISILLSKIEIIVTDKRVYGTTTFGTRVDLPIDSISAIKITILKGIGITTSSGIIKFIMIKNRDAIHKEVSNLLINRQTKPELKTNNNISDIKELKELLDNGIITKEEFEQKKKQILNI